jgi:hypothetical protein
MGRAKEDFIRCALYLKLLRHQNKRERETVERDIRRARLEIKYSYKNLWSVAAFELYVKIVGQY